MKCVCRMCEKVYDDQKATADYVGYCTQKCFVLKAKELGWTRDMEKWAEKNVSKKEAREVTQFGILKRHGQIGSVPYKG